MGYHFSQAFIFDQVANAGLHKHISNSKLTNRSLGIVRTSYEQGVGFLSILTHVTHRVSLARSSSKCRNARTHLDTNSINRTLRILHTSDEQGVGFLPILIFPIR